jgi:hypothetical protein
MDDSERQTTQRVIAYSIEIVGGPFDGAGGMNWLDDGGLPPPEFIMVGVCPGDGSCKAHYERPCKERARQHTYFWLPREPGMPARTSMYELSDSFLMPEGQAPRSEIPGKAIYTIHGLQLPRSPQERELVAAGHYEERSSA